jgi:hypothetical protein
LEAGMQVYPLNPKSAQAYRERKAPSGVKDDQLDAWSFADALLALALGRPTTHAQVHCALQIGYFKAKQAFFLFSWDQVKEDSLFRLTDTSRATWADCGLSRKRPSRSSRLRW